MNPITNNTAAAETSDPLVVVGEVTAPFGIRGQVKIRPLMDDVAALRRLPFVILRELSGREQNVRVVEARTHPGGTSAMIAFEGFTDRNIAEGLRGAVLLIRQSELPPLGEDTYYEGQLIGLRVVTESGRDFGPIEQVHFYPANDVYETPVALIPAVGDMIVSVDLAGGKMVVRDVPGLRKDE